MTSKWYPTSDWKTILGFWLLGVCNNFGYCVILTAAYDLLSITHEVPANSTFTLRECNSISSGVILLADIAPHFIIKLVSPFFPLWIHFRVAVTVVFAIGGFVFVASKESKLLLVLGVILTSVSSGIGESSLLMYMPFFNTNNVISAWSGGTGAAGVLGSLSYLGLIALGFPHSTTLYSMLLAPIVMSCSFWLLLKHPTIDETNVESNLEYTTGHDRTTFMEKLKITYKLLGIYLIPFTLVYFFQYTINQGLFELIYFKDSIIDLADQIRWYNFDYQVGVLISRSTGSLLELDYLWTVAVLQGLNLVVMTTESIFGWMGHASYSFWIVVAVIFWEGLLAGISYYNTFRRINDEMPPGHRQFSMSMTSLGGPIGITLAGLFSIPLHDAICTLPPP